jgi:homoserine dehydrogenase
VLGDLVAVARHRVGGGLGPGESSYADLPILPMGDAQTRYYVSLDVADRSGVLAKVAAAFAEHNVSIETVRQRMGPDERDGDRHDVGEATGNSNARANLVIVTHAAPDAALSATVESLRTLDVVRGVNSVMRVEGS